MEHIIKYFTNSNKNGVFVFYDSWPTLNNAEKELLSRQQFLKTTIFFINKKKCIIFL